MEKFSKKLILDYISGNDIEEYDLEYLEDNPEFMMQVIGHTRDKNLYNLCSYKVKNNYDFIRFMIETFKDDEKFIVGIVDDYLEKKLDFKKSFELIIIINDILKYSNYKYLILLNEAVKRILNDVSYILKNLEKSEVKALLGTGFYIIKDNYSDSKVILDFMAKKMAGDIFSSPSISVFLHARYKKFSDIQTQNLNTFIINEIEKKDCYLSSYVACNVSLLDDLKAQIKQVGKNWDSYLEKLDKLRWQVIHEKTIDYLTERFINKFNYYDIISYVCKKLNVEYSYDEDYPYKTEVDYDYLNMLSEQNDFEFLGAEKYVTQLITNIFKNDYILDDDDSYDNFNNAGNIIDFSSIKRT